MAVLDLLKNTPLFKNLGEDELRSVLAAAYKKSAPEGSFLYMQGDPAKTIYLLLEGRIRLAQVTPEGQQVILRYATPGEAFGVIAMLSESEYPVAAQPVEDSLALAWDHEELQRLMEENPKLAQNALRILADRVQQFQDRLREMATERVERRIARVLIRLARQTGRKTEQGILIDLPLSRQDLAEMTGTTLYTVSRTMRAWEEQGIIISGREQVTIRFPHGLVRIAEDLPNRGKSQ